MLFPRKSNPARLAVRAGQAGTYRLHVAVIRIILGRHEKHLESIDELHSGQRGHAHVQEDAEQDCERYLLEQWLHQDGETCGRGGRHDERAYDDMGSHLECELSRQCRAVRTLVQ